MSCRSYNFFLQGQFTSFFSVYVAMPLIYLPSKETIEEILLKGRRKMSVRENLLCTFVLVFISWVFAIFVPSIADAMALAGCTTNPMVRSLDLTYCQIGFIIPVLLYQRIHKDKPWTSKEKLTSGFVAFIIILTSILGLINFILKKTVG